MNDVAQSLKETVKVETKDKSWLLCDLATRKTTTGACLDHAIKAMEKATGKEVQLPLRYVGFEHLTTQEFAETAGQAAG